VLKLIKKLGLSKNKITKLCNVSYNRLLNYNSLSKPFVKKVMQILESEINKQGIKESDLDYIKWLVSCDQEFIRIKEVKVYDNFEKKPVYDIELEPCKFFIAGNKPMNVFDTVRKFTKEPWTPIHLMKFKTLSPEILAYLWLLIENGSNIMVIGSTGTGKTTFLNAIAFFIPPSDRVVSIEDTRELQLKHENWLPSVTREGVGFGVNKQGEVTLFDLLKESFRQRPDYIIVGEIRGKEAYVLFQGAASGHPAMSTMHADSVETMVRRLETPPINLPASLVEILDVGCIMTQTRIRGKTVRRIREITEIVKVREGVGNVQTNTPFFWDPKTDRFYFRTDSHAFDKLTMRKGISKPELYREFQLRSKLLLAMYKNNIYDFKEVQEIIHDYFKNPKSVLARFKIV